MSSREYLSILLHWLDLEMRIFFSLTVKMRL